MLRLFGLFLLLFSASAAAGLSGISIPEIEKRLNAYPSNLKLKYVLSRAYAQRGRSQPLFYDKAISQLEEIMDVRQIPVVKFYLGLMHARKGNLDTAIYHWQTIVRSMKPNNLTTLRYLALAFEKKKKHAESLKHWNRILSLNPENYKAHYHAALVTLRNRSLNENVRYARAIQHFRKVLSKFENHSKTLWYLSLTYRQSRQYLKQRSVLQKLVSRLPNHPRVLRELQLNAQNLQRQPQDAKLEIPQDSSSSAEPKEPPQPREPDLRKDSPRQVSVAMEISDDEFAAAFGKDPEEQEVPVDHEPEKVAENPTLPIDSPLSADAEMLFNQGVTYMQNGEYDLALFHFLQAQELDPKFAQCYLQIGEVYFKLADATPTEEKFREHLRLSRQSLQTAQQLEPDSLLAHAAEAKLVQVEKKDQQGFEKAHIAVAAGAIRQGNYRFAAEEFIILLSNGMASHELLFLVADTLENLDDGARLDLRNVLESYVSDGKIAGHYLLSSMLFPSDKDRAWQLADQIFELKDQDVRFFEALKSRSSSNQTSFLDEYLLGRYLQKSGNSNQARNHFQKALKRSPDKEASNYVQSWISRLSSPDKESGPRLLTPVKPVQSASLSEFELFDAQKKELISGFPAFSEVFDAEPSWGDINAKREFLQTFLKTSPKNMLGHYLLGAIYERSSLEGMQSKSLQKKQMALELPPSSKAVDGDWFFRAGILALLLEDSNQSRAYLDRALYGLLARGFESWKPYSDWLARKAREQLRLNRSDVASRLVQEGFLFHPQSAELAAVKVDVLNDAQPSRVLPYSAGFLWDSLSGTLQAELLKADVGITLFWAVFLSLLTFCAAVTIRCRYELRHLMEELMGNRSLSIPLTALVAGMLIIFFPTGLILFLPLVLWSFMQDLEKILYGLGLALIVMIPVLFPTGYANNREKLRTLHSMLSGDIRDSRRLMQERLMQNPLDLDAKFQMGLLEYGTGAGPKAAIQLWESVLAEQPEHVPTLGNLGAAWGRLGDLDKAQEYLSKAFDQDPINDRVIFNLGRIYELKGNADLASRHFSWIGGSGEQSRQNIERYIKFKKEGLPLFACFSLESSISKHDTWFAPVYESPLSMDLLFFVLWFLLGGGLVGGLLFAKDRMDITMTRCRYCDARICGNCQSTLGGQALCSECFDSQERRGKGLQYFRKLEARETLELARRVSFVLPGVGHVVRSEAYLCFLIAVPFWFGLLWFTGFSGLFQMVMQYNNSILNLVGWVFLAGSLLIYALAQALNFMDTRERALLA